jgi:putative transposase
VFGTCANGRQLKFSPSSTSGRASALAIDVAGSIRSRRVIDMLSRLVSVHGAPTYLRSDNGPEFIAKAIVKWALDESIRTALIDPGKPWQNEMDESFNGRFRDECLSVEWFRSRGTCQRG